jgi:hypothetical protein
VRYFFPIDRAGYDIRIASRFDQRIHAGDKNLRFLRIVLIHIRRARRLCRAHGLG